MANKKMKPPQSGLSILILLGSLACMMVIAVAGYHLVSQYVEYKAGTDSYGELASAVRHEAGQWSPEAQGRDTLAPPGGWPDVSFADLRQKNTDVAGWLMMPDSNIDYPVVQGADNEYYLKRLFNGKINTAGTLFIDARNQKGLLDANTVIYGHNMKNGTMLHALTLYKDQDYYEAHPRMYLMTPEQNYVIELFSGFVTRVSDDSWQRAFQNEGSYADWIQRAKKKSTFKADVSVDSEDRCVTLSTCSYEYDDARYVVIGKLIRAS